MKCKTLAPRRPRPTRQRRGQGCPPCLAADWPPCASGRWAWGAGQAHWPAPLLHARAPLLHPCCLPKADSDGGMTDARLGDPAWSRGVVVVCAVCTKRVSEGHAWYCSGVFQWVSSWQFCPATPPPPPRDDAPTASYCFSQLSGTCPFMGDEREPVPAADARPLRLLGMRGARALAERAPSSSRHSQFLRMLLPQSVSVFVPLPHPTPRPKSRFCGACSSAAERERGCCLHAYRLRERVRQCVTAVTSLLFCMRRGAAAHSLKLEAQGRQGWRVVVQAMMNVGPGDATSNKLLMGRAPFCVVMAGQVRMWDRRAAACSIPKIVVVRVVAAWHACAWQRVRMAGPIVSLAG